MTDRASRSYPPRGLSREDAAYYVGVGTTTFDQMVADGRMPRPAKVGKRVVWDRHKLDAAFSDLGESRENYFDGGLKVVGRSG